MRADSSLVAACIFAVVGLGATSASAETDDERMNRLPSHGGEVVAHSDASAFGLRGGLTRVRYGDARASSLSLTLSGRREAHAVEHGIALRVVNTFAIGGGPDGLEGHIGMAVAAGFRAPIAKYHGPMTRIGGEALLQGSRTLYYSLLEVPQLQLGYQYLAPGKLAEGGFKGGYLLAGYYRADDGNRPLGASYEWGAFANVNIEPLRLRGAFTRVLAGAPSPSLNVLEAEVCSRRRPIIVCTDTQVFFGEAGDRSRGTLYGSRAVSFGFTIGFSDK